MTFSSLTKPVQRAAAVAAAFAVLCLTAACGGQADPAPTPVPSPSAPASVEQASDASNALRENFNATNNSAPWAVKVTEIKLDGRGVIVTSTLTKADKATTKAICEAALKAVKEAKIDFQSVNVRSADGAHTLAHQNEKYGPAACEN